MSQLNKETLLEVHQMLKSSSKRIVSRSTTILPECTTWIPCTYLVLLYFLSMSLHFICLYIAESQLSITDSFILHRCIFIDCTRQYVLCCCEMLFICFNSAVYSLSYFSVSAYHFYSNFRVPVSLVSFGLFLWPFYACWCVFFLCL